tara:strand:- start:80 stop:1432 length:1353 start_codon:yes stop_codon:yes gene_type:complete
MNYVDLFAGAGGMSIGFKRAGYNHIFANEIDKHASSTLSKNNPKDKVITCSIERLVKKLGITNINKDYIKNSVNTGTRNNMYKIKNEISDSDINFIESNKNNIDIVIGGPPCQGFSQVARGKKKKYKRNVDDFIDDSRNHLFKYFLSLVNYFNAKYVVIENVKGITSTSDYVRNIEDSLRLTGKGYEPITLLLNAADFGVPQNRERVFFIGVRKDISTKLDINQIKDTIYKNTKDHISLKESIDDLPKIKANPKKLNTKKENEIPIGKKGSFGENESTISYKDLISEKTEYVKNICRNYENKKIYPKKLYNHKCRFNNSDDLKIYTLLKAGAGLISKENEEALKLVKYDIGVGENTKKDSKSFTDKYHKLDPNKPSRTIVAHLNRDNNGYVHYGKNPRGISPREAARIQSFPDWYKFEGPLTTQYKQIGNAVPPLLAEVIANAIKEFNKL